MSSELDGLLTFFSSHHAIRAERTLRRAGHASELVPGPKDISPNCGTAVRFRFDETDQILSLLDEHHVEIDGVHPWKPRTDSWRARRERRARE